MRVLVLGGSGMLGHTVFHTFANNPQIEVFATLRNASGAKSFSPALHDRLLAGVDATDFDTVTSAFLRCRPQVLVNCVGLVKQLGSSKDPLSALPINAILPHRLARLCAVAGARLVHVSTDCVFSGRQGGYTEADFPDADDLYGRSKLLGEVDESHAVTLRTSIIGREIGSRNGLVEWFLGERGLVKGFTKAVFSGVTTNELARVIVEHILPHSDLRGVWHVSSSPIAKHDLLMLLRAEFGTKVEIEPDPSLVIDRSLDSSRFREATGYTPPEWARMIADMQQQGE